MNNTQQQILDIFQGYRMQPTAVDQYEQVGKQILADKMLPFINGNQPIKFAMLGLPFKSTNTRDKVLGELPDLGEELTVRNFEQFNADVKTVYAPGVNIVVASDGYVFNDLLGIDNKIVNEYRAVTESFKNNNTLNLIDLNYFYKQGSIEEKRSSLMKDFGYHWVKMEQEILFNPDVNFLYRGMLVFMEEELASKDFPSKSQRAKAAKKLVREMMLRNEAYNLIVRKELSDHIRLSMHKSVNNGYKYSFKLIPGQHATHSAWHSTIVMDGSEAITIHKIDAQNAGYKLAYKYNRPYNFVKI